MVSPRRESEASIRVSERQYWVAFSMVSGIGPAKVGRLLARFGSLAEAWGAGSADLRDAGLDRRAIRSLNETRRRIDPGAELARLDRLGIAALTWDDDAYPALLGELRKIDQAPPVLYVRGTLLDGDEWALAVVGTRRASPYGRQVTHRLASELAASGLTIVSGLARGLDAEAHRAALDAGGRTIAVLPCGLDTVYPPEHAHLAAEIVRRGALVSPFPVGMAPRRGVIAARNFVMSGLARGVLVCEAGEKSGTLITAGHALEQGREVFAVPGNITAHGSAGTNRLIQDGAHPVLDTADILDVLQLEHVAQFREAREHLPETTGDEGAVLAQLSAEPTHVDDLTQRSGLAVSAVSSALVTLELKGLARQVGPMLYVKS
jgi:DNA processing protein